MPNLPRLRPFCARSSVEERWISNRSGPDSENQTKSCASAATWLDSRFTARHCTARDGASRTVGVGDGRATRERWKSYPAVIRTSKVNPTMVSCRRPSSEEIRCVRPLHQAASRLGRRGTLAVRRGRAPRPCRGAKQSGSETAPRLAILDPPLRPWWLRPTSLRAAASLPSRENRGRRDRAMPIGVSSPGPSPSKRMKVGPLRTRTSRPAAAWTSASNARATSSTSSASGQNRSTSSERR